ncbi:hypothetical protein [Aliiroseovarius subalbicans]|uniref:hypothetical protein n=1 Tax=Aliiroseovarius subalbicans TaxID=2925840 RepID=UPI001F58A7C4|nr:hypothetical protein [Aliiroseovarius subalbicans]MCI2398384.1 hypothetical protein [Aliiroseovarius subalbicans]
MLKHFLTSTLATGLIVTASMAQAFEVTGGDLAFSYGTEQGDPSGQYSVLGSVDTAITDRFGLQFDGAVWTYSGAGVPTLWGVGLHATYAMYPNWDIGLFVTHEDWAGPTQTGYGAEVAYHEGPLSVDAAIGQIDETSSAQFATLSGEYAFAETGRGYSVTAGAFYLDQVVGTMTRLSIGARYGFDNGAYGEIAYIHEDNPFGTDEVLTVNFGIEFGAGTTFNSRLSPVLIPGN